MSQLQQLALIKRQKISELTSTYNNSVSALTSTYNSNCLSISRNRLMPTRTKKTLLAQLYNKFVTDKNNLYSAYKNAVAKINALTVADIFPPTPPPSNQQQVIKSPKKSALLIGINYIGTSNQLSGCINDVESINQLLQTYKYDSITLLTDNTPIKPTKNNILSSLKTLFSNAKDGDTLYIHYSGHGTNTRDSNGDESDNMDEVIVPLDFNSIVDDELRQYINNYLTVNANVLAVFDCCYSGTVLDLKYLYRSDNNTNFSQNLNYNDTKSNIVLISGCRDDQLSSEAYTDKKIEGAMSWTFKKVITEKSSNISWKTLINNMRDILLSADYDQVPQLSTGRSISIDSKMFI